MSKFVEIASFYELPLAELAKAKLESEQIYCFLHSKHHISLKFYISIALGGVRVYVKSDDKERAKEILNSDESKLLSEIDFPAPDSNDLCKNCGSENLKKVDLKVVSGYLMILTGLPLIFWRSYYKCNECGFKNKKTST